jgi:hypothetical protein
MMVLIEGGGSMKLTFALVALFLVFSVPAHAQAAGGSASTTRTGGGGSFGGGTSGSSGAQPTYTPTKQFQMSAVSGSSNDFVPSAYLPFDKAVALGQNYSAAKPATIVEVAQAYKNTKGSAPEHVIVQDRRGNFVEDSK